MSTPYLDYMDTTPIKPAIIKEDMKTFASGAKRSNLVPRYDLIPAEGLRRLAERYTLGAAKYGEYNWQKGLLDKEYVDQFKCHLIEHFYKYITEGCSKDDNLAAVAWGAFALMEAEKKAKEFEVPGIDHA